MGNSKKNSLPQSRFGQWVWSHTYLTIQERLLIGLILLLLFIGIAVRAYRSWLLQDKENPASPPPAASATR